MPPLCVASAEHVQSDEEIIMLRYLPDVGTARAEAIVEAFGSGNVRGVLDSDDAAEQLSSICGISDSMANDIKEAWDDKGCECLCGAGHTFYVCTRTACSMRLCQQSAACWVQLGFGAATVSIAAHCSCPAAVCAAESAAVSVPHNAVTQQQYLQQCLPLHLAVN
jgi:hypothetical protein